MAASLTFSPLFENEGGGGILMALPYEAIGEWKPREQDDPLLDRCLDVAHLEPLGPFCGVVVNDLEGEGIMEAHWLRVAGQPGVILAVWASWDDPSRPTYPEDMKRVGRSWLRGEDPRQAWLAARLEQPGDQWERLEGVQTVPIGVLLQAPKQGTWSAAPSAAFQSDPGPIFSSVRDGAASSWKAAEGAALQSAPHPAPSPVGGVAFPNPVGFDAAGTLGLY